MTEKQKPSRKSKPKTTSGEETQEKLRIVKDFYIGNAHIKIAYII